MSVFRSFLLMPVVALSFGMPAYAQQDAPAQPAADSTRTVGDETPSDEEIAFNERSAALGRRVLAVDEAMKSAARRAVLDPTGAKQELDDLQATFQAEMDAFIQDFLNFAATQFTALPEDELATKRKIAENRAAELSSLPQAMRDRAEAAARLPAPPQDGPPTN
ncbi:hypothetical protein HZ989_04315 [Brevundimonas sp. AJA228-03]|uniref:hypothetical protein n=1 Tax=Brevundimonas sp. AJA228-03 TaxID=2752515 RepID=UPI001ADECEC8|nr:hypothetical protein [Brevundimonas sp. AJA228-03]QTN20298.1 hypothetical protein HZ989_04315 [Brevundimonas sp. AJA228-03]